MNNTRFYTGLYLLLILLFSKAGAQNPDSTAAAYYAEGNYWKLLEYSREHDIDTLSPKFQFYLGMSCAALGELQRAQELLTKAIARDSSSLQYRYQYGRLLTQSGMYGEAIEQLTECIAMDSLFIPAHFQLGLTYAAWKQDPEKEIGIFSSLVSRNPSDVPSMYYLADALKRTGRQDTAATLLWLALRNNPRYYPALIAYSNYLSGKKRYLDAMPYYLRADSLRSNNKDLKYQIGECLRKLGDLPAAKYYFKQAIALDSMDGMYHAQLAYTHFSAGEYDSSAAEYHKAILYDEENAQYHLNLALVYKKLGMTDMVVRSYNSAIKVMHPENIAYAYNDLAAFYFGKNMWREAIQTYQRVVDINPANVEAIYYMGTSHERLSEVKKAIELYALYIQKTESDPTKTMARNSIQKYIEQLKVAKKK